MKQPPFLAYLISYRRAWAHLFHIWLCRAKSEATPGNKERISACLAKCIDLTREINRLRRICGR